MLLSVSLLNSKDKKKDILYLNNTNINYFHIDVMDGKFVSQKSFNDEEIKTVSESSNKPLDVHLMVKNPNSYIRRLKRLNNINNINNITIHLEIEKDIRKILKAIRKSGIKCGLAIKPNTDIDLLKPYLDIVDIILIMTVEPGLGGQKFIEESIDRISKIKKMTETYSTIIEVDGGINDQTIKKAAQADITVVGSYITTSDDMAERINSLQK